MLQYFEAYLDKHLRSWVSNFDTAKTGYNLDLNPGDSGAGIPSEEERVTRAVREYIKTKVGTALVLGGYKAPSGGV